MKILENVEIERKVLSALMSDENTYTTLKDKLQKEYFVDYECKTVHQIMCDIDAQGKIPEMLEVAMALQEKGGDISHFMFDEYMPYLMTVQRIETLKSYYAKRQLIMLCNKGMKIASDPLADESEVDNLIIDFQKVTEADCSNIQTIGDVVNELRTDIISRRNETMPLGMMTGLHIFDVRKGFHEGDLVVIAGETSQGKSTLATTIARNMAVEGIPLAYYSLEMSSKQLTARIMARDLNISSSRVLFDKLSDAELNQYVDVTKAMQEFPIYFDESNKTTFSKICLSIRAMVRKHGIKICFIDYLQILANGSDKDNREQMIGDMARDLKRLAVEERICVVALSQLSRDKQNPEPTINRLRGSGQIEEACDTIITVYRPEVYKVLRYKDGKSTEGTAELKIAKGRNIGLAEEVVMFNSQYTYFSDYDENKVQTSVKEEEKPW